jgi:hypothetical protein
VPPSIAVRISGESDFAGKVRPAPMFRVAKRSINVFSEKCVGQNRNRKFSTLKNSSGGGTAPDVTG